MPDVLFDGKGWHGLPQRFTDPFEGQTRLTKHPCAELRTSSTPEVDLVMILVTGGTRSGKSTLAERLAADFAGRVLYVATAEPGDEEMRLRIERHQAARPPEWGTLNAPRDAMSLLREEEGKWDTILFDCLTLYTTNLLLENEVESPDPEVVLIQGMQTLADYLVENWPQSVVVTNEVGSGIVPVHRLSRLFRDLQGRVNQVFARRADEVYLCVSGIPLKIKGPDSPWPVGPGLGGDAPALSAS